MFAICTWALSEIHAMQFASEHGQIRDQRLASSHAHMSTTGNRCQVKAMLTSAMSVLRKVIVLRRAGDIQSPAANGLSDMIHQPESAPGQSNKYSNSYLHSNMLRNPESLQSPQAAHEHERT